MKKLVLILIPVLFISCSSSMQHTWDNFRAYYNTFYHAKKNFQAGHKMVKDQPVTINPSQPIRVHPTPNGAGNEYFSKTIEKGIRILRKFPDTKWADEAAFLIGKSYYYRGEFYQAMRKFEELYKLNADWTLRQQAVIWKGRTLLDLNRHQEAIIYLENELNRLDAEWIPKLKVEVEVLLGEHYAMVANWELAADYLARAVQGISNKPFLGRTYFLYAQVLEQLQRYGEAYFTYDQVSSNYPDYEYIYWAELKKGEMARTEKNTDLALSIFRSMKRDDKNFERQDELDYEIAFTGELQGDIKTAEEMYNHILHDRSSVVSRDIQARIYHRLGVMYSEQYQDFEAAAAYFDSLSSYASDFEQIGAGQEVEALATAYNQYVSLKNEVSHIDSLLWLSTLTSVELDSVIEQSRIQKKRKLQNQGEEMAGNIFMYDSAEENGTMEDQSSQYGFLNYRNPNLTADSKNKFRAVWGRRPLVDNWRRVELNSGHTRRVGGGPDVSGNIATGEVTNTELQDEQLGIDLSEIPTSAAAKQQLQRRQANSLYEMGNLFFVTLDLPDSAAHYYRRVIRDYSKGETEARSMYALFEMYRLFDQPDSSFYWGNRLVKEYPDTKYARRSTSRPEVGKGTVADSNNTLLTRVQAIESMSDSISVLNRARRYRRLALDNHSLKSAEAVYRRAIENYVDWARGRTDSTGYRKFWNNFASGVNDEAEFTSDLKSEYETLFSSQPWDSVRTVLKEYHSVFEDAPAARQIQELESILELRDKETDQASKKN